MHNHVTGNIIALIRNGKRADDKLEDQSLSVSNISSCYFSRTILNIFHIFSHKFSLLPLALHVKTMVIVIISSNKPVLYFYIHVGYISNQ